MQNLQHIAIIDYGAGNLRSVSKALEFVVKKENIQAEIALVTTPEALHQATHIILPGVGAFADCIRGLQNLTGIIKAMEIKVLEQKTPFLGICVGMQMLLERGYEHGEHKGLGWFEGEVRPLTPADKNLKIPHMGWNNIATSAHPLFQGIENNAHAYFVHSYHCVMKSPSDIIATTEYSGAVTAAIARENIFGLQFHPEKSQETGLRLFRNFLQHSHASSR